MTNEDALKPTFRPTVLLRDDGSKYGTFVNADNIQGKGDVDIKEADIIKFGTMNSVMVLEWRPVTACLPSLSRNEKTEILGFGTQLGITFTKEWNDRLSTHLYLKDIRLTAKLMRCLACAKPIVSIEWFRALAGTTDVGFEWPSGDFLPPEANNDGLIRAEDCRPKPERKTLFSGFEFWLFCSDEEYNTWKDIIASASGRSQHCMLEIPYSESALTARRRVIVASKKVIDNDSSSWQGIKAVLERSNRTYVLLQNLADAIVQCSTEVFFAPFPTSQAEVPERTGMARETPLQPSITYSLMEPSMRTSEATPQPSSLPAEPSLPSVQSIRNEPAPTDDIEYLSMGDVFDDMVGDYEPLPATSSSSVSRSEVSQPPAEAITTTEVPTVPQTDLSALFPESLDDVFDDMVGDNEPVPASREEQQRPLSITRREEAEPAFIDERHEESVPVANNVDQEDALDSQPSSVQPPRQRPRSRPSTTRTQQSQRRPSRPEIIPTESTGAAREPSPTVIIPGKKYSKIFTKDILVITSPQQHQRQAPANDNVPNFKRFKKAPVADNPMDSIDFIPMTVDATEVGRPRNPRPNNNGDEETDYANIRIDVRRIPKRIRRA